MLIKRRLDKYILMYSYNRKKNEWNTALLHSKDESQKYMFKWEKKQVTWNLKKVQCNFFKAKKKKTKPAKIRNVLFRTVYVSSKKKKKKVCAVFCCVLLFCF